MFNIEFEQPIGALADSLGTTLSTQGIYAIVGILVVSVLGPIYTAISKKSVMAIWSSISTWTYLSIAIASVLTLLGIAVPPGSAEALVAAIWAKDWATVGTIGTISFLVPLIRWIKSKSLPATPTT
jgi:hypothetical protein